MADRRLTRLELTDDVHQPQMIHVELTEAEADMVLDAIDARVNGWDDEISKDAQSREYLRIREFFENPMLVLAHMRLAERPPRH